MPDVEVAPARLDHGVPPHSGQPLLKLVRLVVDLHGPELASVLKRSTHDPAAQLIFMLEIRPIPKLVDEEEAAFWRHRQLDQPPEIVKAVVGNMRKPECKEQEIVLLLRPPRKQ